jgi:stalled ribosome rescue protein Dom34
MKNSEKKVISIWIDSTHAYLFATKDRTLNGEVTLLEKIVSKDHSDDRHKNDKTEMEKEKQDLRKMYKEIEKHSINDDVIFIFGPGKAQEQLKNHLEDNHLFKVKDIQIGSSDHLTTKQMIEHIELHFGM